MRSRRFAVVLACVALLAGRPRLPAQDKDGKAEVLTLYRRALELKKALKKSVGRRVKITIQDQDDEKSFDVIMPKSLVK